MCRATARAAWLAPLLIGGAVSAGLWWSWLKWPDPQIDFGRELYVPWRLSLGDVLYRDIASWTGPLSVYWHALLFRVFGASLRTVVASNVGVLLLTLHFIFQCTRRLGDWLAALTTCLVIVATSAFVQVIQIGNYNFMAPYRHELTHGLLVGFIGLDCLARYLATGRVGWAFAAGAACGLSLLTKIEIVLATVSALPIGLMLALAARRCRVREALRVLSAFALGVLAPSLLALGLLSTVLPLPRAFAGLLGPFEAALSGRYTSSLFFQTGAGLDDPLSRLAKMGRSTLLITLGVGALIVAARVWRGPARAPVLGAASLALALGIWPLVSPAAWLHLAHALPVLIVLSAVLLMHHARRSATGLLQAAAVHVPLFVFSSALLVKLGLNPRTFHYGFALALPALVLVCTALVSWLPAWLGPERASNSVLRAGLVVCLLSFGFAHIRRSERHFAERIHPLGQGGDRFFGDVRAETFEQLRLAIEATAARDATVTVVPEGVMLSYLTRRPSAIGNLELIPTELAFFGEEHIVASLEASPPDYVAIVHRDTSEYGARIFGRDYGVLIASFLGRNYVPRALIGEPHPRGDSRSRAVLLVRRAPPLQPPATP